MLQVQNSSFAYDTKTVISDVSFSIEKGSNVAVIGESGCGKSTLLKLIYGLYDLNEGTIHWDGTPVLGPKYNLVPGVDAMKYLAQDFDLMPYITVAENVGKFLSNIYPEKKKQRVQELLEMVEMTEFANIKTKYLSGGQQQRVALARVLALEPEVLLLDEPFSNIDSFRKGALRRNLFAYLKAKGITCIIATHDSIDALSFSDETIVMKDGSILAHDASPKIYLKPESKYVASLYGEVNEMALDLFDENADENQSILVYSHELFLTEQSNLEVTAKHSYYKGNTFLIKGVYDKKVLFFENPFPIEDGQKVFLTIDDEVVMFRR
ncbi:ABC transporter ATP-binding protein [Flavobacterium tegetincola]|uniref:ABC transporter ATP-binding protein n=1 Tax=Flavobacterium tegetincola TaxID=150172 RepID=UPI000412122A|nr:ABC transporter ATP-binding protein [Flavobacterium tegetincola]